MKLMNEKIRYEKVLIKWILTCLLILIIPCISILYNYSYNNHLIKEQINEANNTILTNIQYAIDTKLNTIMNLSHLLLIDTKMDKLIESGDNINSFKEKSYDYYSQLNNYTYVYHDLDIVLYLPKHDFMITAHTANHSNSIYNTLKYMKKSTITYESWNKLLNTSYPRGSFLITPHYSYKNFGVDSFVYACTSPFVYKEELKYNLLISTPTTFISSYLDDTSESSFYILNETGNQLVNYGPSITEDLESYRTKDSNPNTFKTTIDGREYMSSSIRSNVSNWTYVIFTPSNSYLSRAISVRNVTIISLIGSFLIGLIVIYISQEHNYKPIRKLLGTLPVNMKSSSSNEFDLMEQYYYSISSENNRMKKKIGTFSDMTKDIYFLSKLKGRDFHLSEGDILDSLQLDFKQKKLALVTVYMDNEEELESDSINYFDLFSFAIDNILHDMIGEHYNYRRVLDGVLNNFIFFMDDETGQTDYKQLDSYFDQLYSFFHDNFQIELSITISDLFSNMDDISSNYVDILGSLEYRHILGVHGIFHISELNQINGNDYKELEKYTQPIKMAVVQKKLGTALLLSKELFQQLSYLELPFIKSQYHIHSIIASLLIQFDTITNELDKEHLERYLRILLLCNDKQSLQREFESLLHFFCGDAILSNNPVDNEFIRSIKDYVQDYYQDCNMNIASIAEAMSLSPKYMSKLFKDVHTEGLLNYMNEVRIEHAKELLKTCKYSVDEVSVLVGYSNTRSFRRNFLKVTGSNPKEYKK